MKRGYKECTSGIWDNYSPQRAQRTQSFKIEKNKTLCPSCYPVMNTMKAAKEKFK
ncbi:hypothetical protein BFAG_01142 [Bacteroides fragilis 3_1_12]|uniref:Uncharacterized protein n=1 Tax=Bacteroides fragilis 3_1_12 TaxID=457424 RepID=A0ABN0BHN4_BACFG|nr:hypothetical protein BFAG_01142 [Bacteroides fragilis 3_1_12]